MGPKTQNDDWSLVRIPVRPSQLGVPMIRSCSTFPFFQAVAHHLLALTSSGGSTSGPQRIMLLLIRVHNGWDPNNCTFARTTRRTTKVQLVRISSVMNTNQQIWPQVRHQMEPNSIEKGQKARFFKSGIDPWEGLFNSKSGPKMFSLTRNSYFSFAFF